MGEEPRENPKLRMYKNIIQENEEGSSFIFWCIKYSYPFLSQKGDQTAPDLCVYRAHLVVSCHGSGGYAYCCDGSVPFPRDSGIYRQSGLSGWF